MTKYDYFKVALLDNKTFMTLIHECHKLAEYIKTTMHVSSDEVNI